MDDGLRGEIAEAEARRRIADESLGPWRYRRVERTFRSLLAGTAILGDTVIFGYPRVARIFRLDAGLRAQLDHPFWVEEKVDGYNVRVFAHEGQILALTRRGYLCSFTTDRIPDLMDTRIFETHPDLVLCAEVAGPENPYHKSSPPYVSEDVRLFAFDLMRKNRSGFLTHDEKSRLLVTFGIPQVTVYGRYTTEDLASLAALALELDRSGREGMVLKEDSERERRVKYVTGHINLSDLRAAGPSIKQRPAEYYAQRLLRLALFLDEHHIERTTDLYQELGESLIEGVLTAVAQWRREGKVMDSFRCRFRRRENAELFMHALEKVLGVHQAPQQRLEQAGDFYILEFAKVLPRTTGLLSHLLRGGIVFD